ncbi:hypothetical protein DFH06DRAFT_1226569 [Mycena polygramma]|nr:hypothetical protein DFH06DRAFT_1226569 [Mycena polygramma]
MKRESTHREEMHKMRARVSELEEENRESRRQLEEALRTPTQAFGTTADRASMGDVRRQEFGSKTSAPRRREHDSELLKRLTPILGGELVPLLSARGQSRPVPEILVQIALQTAVSRKSLYKLSKWAVGDHSGNTDRVLSGLYHGIHDDEDHEDTSRWRAITRKQLAKHASQVDVKPSLLRLIADVVNLTIPPNEEPVTDRRIEAKVGDRVGTAAGLILDLHRIIGTNVVSEDLEATFVEPGIAFDPRTMENMWPEEASGKSQEDVVVCTTSLGVRKLGKHGGDPPKVLLRSSLPQLMM